MSEKRNKHKTVNSSSSNLGDNIKYSGLTPLYILTGLLVIAIAVSFIFSFSPILCLLTILTTTLIVVLFLIPSRFETLRTKYAYYFNFIITLIGTFIGVLGALYFNMKYDQYKAHETFKEKLKSAKINLAGSYLAPINIDSADYEKILNFVGASQTGEIDGINRYFDTNLPNIDYILDFLLNDRSFEDNCKWDDLFTFRNNVQTLRYYDGRLRGRIDSVKTMQNLHLILRNIKSSLIITVIDIDRIENKSRVSKYNITDNMEPHVQEYNKIIERVNSQIK